MQGNGKETPYPTAELVAGSASSYSKTAGGELFSCPIGVAGGEEKVAIVFFGGASGDRYSREAVQRTAQEIAGRYNLHEGLVLALKRCRALLGPEDASPEGHADVVAAADAVLARVV